MTTSRHRSKGASEIRTLHSPVRQSFKSRIERIVTNEFAGTVILLLASLVALVWANSPWNELYHKIVNQTITLDFGILVLSKSLQHWINDGLMAIFFFVVGLEIKGEMVSGELSSAKKASLPILAAIGGMILPAVVFTMFNIGSPYQNGWGIPMATDIAFALGVYAIVGKKFPPQLRVFLLAVAIADDIGAILVIALFYTEQFSLVSMTFSVLIFGVVLFLRGLGYRPIIGYVVVGIIFWLAVLKSGVHATIAGVILGLLTPARPLVEKSEFLKRLDEMISQISNKKKTSFDEEERIFGRLEILVLETESPLARLERLLQPWVAFAVLPIFALVNAGVSLDLEYFYDALRHPVGAGIILGLLVGKPVGILAMSLVGVKLGVVALPKGVRWSQLTGVAFLAGIGFTVSLFLTGLAYTDNVIANHAKTGVFVGSALAAVLAVAFLLFTGRKIRPAAGG